MIQIDTTTLTQLITNCFDASMDGRFNTNQQSQFNSLGKQLRGDLLTLLTVYFNDGTTAVINANTQLATVNTSVQNAANNLAAVVTTIQAVANLAGVLDGLVSLALKVV